MTATISILMAAYNAAGFIQEAIENVRQQTHQNWELLVIDDASSDNTTEVVQKLADADPRIRLIRSPQNGGPGMARNLGLAAATGEWITVLDSDDKYVPTRLEKMLHYAEAHHLDVVADNHLLYNLEEKKIFNQGFYSDKEAHALTPEMLILNDCLGQWFPFGLLKPFMRRSVLLAHGLRYPETRLGEDFCLFFSLLLRCRGKAALLSEPLYIYTPHTYSDRSHTKTNADVWEKYRATCRDYLLSEAGHIDNGNKKLIAAIMTRDARLARYVTWRDIRDRSQGWVSLGKCLALFRPSLWPLIGIILRKKLTRRHRIPYLPQDA